MTFYKRHLPYWSPPDTDIFITWRLCGSLPARIGSLEKIESAGEAFAKYDHALDSGKVGPLWLKNPDIAASVVEALTKAHSRNIFRLHAYVLMANHVHVLVTPQSPIAQITQQIKGGTARKSNLILGRIGARFWQDESFDHWIRNPEEWQRIRSYIERNPVSAGLVAEPENWPWSSASHPSHGALK